MATTTKKADPAVKTEEKPAAKKAAAPKAEKKPAAKKAAAPKAEKKPAAKKAAAPKAEKKPAAKKAAAPKAGKVTTVLQYKGVEVSMDDIVAAVKADWTGAAIKTLEIYVKPEDAAAYYVVNGTEGGVVTL